MANEPTVSVVTTNTGSVVSVQVTQNTSFSSSVNTQSGGSFAVTRTAFPTNEIITNQGVGGGERGATGATASQGIQGATGATGSMPSNYVVSVNGVTGAITNIAKTNTAQTFSQLQTFSAGISASGITASSVQHPSSLIISAGIPDSVNFAGIEFIPSQSSIMLYGSPIFDNGFSTPFISTSSSVITSYDNSNGYIENTIVGSGVSTDDGMVTDIISSSLTPIYKSSYGFNTFTGIFIITTLGQTSGDAGNVPTRTQLTQIYAIKNPVDNSITTTTSVNMVSPAGATSIQSYSVTLGSYGEFILNAQKTSQTSVARCCVQSKIGNTTLL